MTAVLATLLELSVLIFAVTSMLSVGLSYTVREIIDPLRDARRVIRAIVANFVLVPLLAYLVLQLIPLEVPRAIGLFLVATAAGAPFLIKLVEAAESDVPLSATLLVLLLPITIVYMPIVVPLALPAAAVNAGAIATPLVVSMLLPLGVGLLVRARARRWADRLRPITQPTSTLSLIVLLVATVVVNFEAILDLIGLDLILAITLIIGGAFGIGFLLGGPDLESREVLGLGTGQRNIAAATVVATQVFDGPETLATVVLASLLALAILFGFAALLRDRGESGDARTEADRRRAA